MIAIHLVLCPEHSPWLTRHVYIAAGIFFAESGLSDAMLQSIKARLTRWPGIPGLIVNSTICHSAELPSWDCLSLGFVHSLWHTARNNPGGMGSFSCPSREGSQTPVPFTWTDPGRTHSGLRGWKPCPYRAITPPWGCASGRRRPPKSPRGTGPGGLAVSSKEPPLVFLWGVDL